MKILLVIHSKRSGSQRYNYCKMDKLDFKKMNHSRMKFVGKINVGIVYRKTDGLEVDCYVLLFLAVC